MRKRNIQMLVRLNDKEATKLFSLVKKSGLSRSAYLRSLINSLRFNDNPLPDYNTMTKNLHILGTTLNQIAQKAHVLNVIDVKRYDENTRAIEKLILEIVTEIKASQK